MNENEKNEREILQWRLLFQTYVTIPNVLPKTKQKVIDGWMDRMAGTKAGASVFIRWGPWNGGDLWYETESVWFGIGQGWSSILVYQKNAIWVDPATHTVMSKRI